MGKHLFDSLLGGVLPGTNKDNFVSDTFSGLLPGEGGERAMVNGAVELPPEVYSTAGQVLSYLTGNPALAVAGNAMAGEQSGGIGQAAINGALTYGGQQLTRFATQGIQGIRDAMTTPAADAAIKGSVGSGNFDPATASGFEHDLATGVPSVNDLNMAPSGGAFPTPSLPAGIIKGPDALSRTLGSGVANAAGAALTPTPSPPAVTGGSVTPGAAAPSGAGGAGPSGLPVGTSTAPKIYPWVTGDVGAHP